MVPYLEPSCFIHSSNSLALSTKSLGHRVKRVIFKNSPLLKKKNFNGYCILYKAFLQFKRERSLLSNNLYINIKVPSLMFISILFENRKSALAISIDLCCHEVEVSISDSPFQMKLITKLCHTMGCGQ